MNNDTISREALKKAFKEAYAGITFSLIECNDLIDNAPPIHPCKDCDLYFKAMTTKAMREAEQNEI